jgi:uncharacterized Zn-finger protein
MRLLRSIRNQYDDGSFPGRFCAASSTTELTPSISDLSSQLSITDQTMNPCPPPPDMLRSCSGRSKVFLSSNELNNSLRSHAGERPFLCSYAECGMSSTRRNTAGVHERHIHESLPYDGDECPKSFVQESELLEHPRSHINEKPFKCLHAGCGMSFARRDNVRTHQRRKHEYQPYTCNECFKPLAGKAEMKRHFLTHPGGRPFRCSYTGCDKSFARRDTARDHERRMHEPQ